MTLNNAKHTVGYKMTYYCCYCFPGNNRIKATDMSEMSKTTAIQEENNILYYIIIVMQGSILKWKK